MKTIKKQKVNNTIFKNFYFYRPKPPDNGSFKVTPAPNLHTYGKIGIKNPHYYSHDNHYGPTTEKYGPDDFIVETVKLDSDFFHQFFTSKPLLIGTDVVTSKSVTTNVNANVNEKFQQFYPRKRSRKTSADLPDTLLDFHQSLTNIVNHPSKLQQMAMQHVESNQPIVNYLKPKGTPIPKSGVSQTLSTTSAPEPKTWTTTTESTSNPTTTTTTTTLRPTQKYEIISDVPKIINSVKTFTRYYIPPEVKVSHHGITAQ